MSELPLKDVSVIGQHGFIGSAVTGYLKQKLGSDNIGESDSCDVLVNCAGFARVYEASQDPKKMGEVEDFTFDRISKIQFRYLIHVSTIHIKCYPDSWYSILKKRMEDKILSLYPNACILRVTGVIGAGMKKNAIYDLVNDKPLWVSADSVYNYITVDELARIIHSIVEYNPIYGRVNVGATTSISMSDVAKLMGKNPIFGQEKHIIKMSISRLQQFFPVKTSEEYLKDYLKEINYAG